MPRKAVTKRSESPISTDAKPISTTRSTRSSPRKSEPSGSSPVVDQDVKESIKEEEAEAAASTAKASPKRSSTLAKKLKQLDNFQKTPFPDYARPSPEECQAVCDALATMHSLPVRPAKIELRDNVGANCGLVPDVLDALVRTILSQNTTNQNSTAARKSIETTFGKGPNYEAVRLGDEEQLRDAIKCGGLANVKARVIKRVLDEVYEKQGKLSLDYLHTWTDQDAMRELVSFDGIGPKTASCVLLFCLGRESFAVDTHVFRITKALGWVPMKADRETSFQHLDVRIPGPLKYPLHAMLVRHGRECKNCSASASPTKSQKDACPIKSFLSKRPTKALEKVDGASESDAEAGSPTPTKKGKRKSPAKAVSKAKRVKREVAPKSESESELSDVGSDGGDMHGLKAE